MSDAVPSYGFTTARRGYAPEQVEHSLSALTAQRDEAWQRLSVLGAHIRELELRLAEASKAASEAPDPDFATLSEQAAGLLAIAENEAKAVREKAERFAEDTRDTTYEAGQARGKAASEYAAATRAEAELAARRTEERTRAEAEKLRGEADRDARLLRDAATGEAAKTRVAAAEAGERAEVKLAELRREADLRFAELEAAAASDEAKISTAAERRLREAEQHRETVLGQIKQTDTEAQAKADQLLDQARREAAGIDAQSAKAQSEFAERQETVQTHLDHIKGTLASLTGKAVGMIEPGYEDAAPKNRPAPAAPAKADAPPAAPGAPAAPTSPAPQPPQAAAPAAPAASAAPAAPVDGPAKPARPAGPASEPGPGPDEHPTTVLRLPAELRDAAPQAARPVGAPVDPRTALLKPADGRPAPAVPPRPGTPPPVPQDERPARSAPEAETAVIPKIVIIDDGTELDSLPNTVGRRRT